MDTETHQLRRKLNKRNRYNKILAQFVEPNYRSRAAKELDMGENGIPHEIIIALALNGCIVQAGKLMQAQLWQATGKPYFEMGVDYDAVKESPPKEELPVGHYVHNPDSKENIEKYRAQSKQTRDERKSARVYVGCVQYG